MGKTHLMHAAGNLMRQHNPGVKVLYQRSEQFFSAMVKALSNKTAGSRADRRVQAPLPLGRRAAARRHPVLRRQGPHAGGVLPHLQRVVREQQQDHPDLRPLSQGSGEPRAAS